jgi:hypothetical protein
LFHQANFDVFTVDLDISAGPPVIILKDNFVPTLLGHFEEQVEETEGTIQILRGDSHFDAFPPVTQVKKAILAGPAADALLERGGHKGMKFRVRLILHQVPQSIA